MAAWAKWMLENSDALGLTNALNPKKPKRPDVVDWCQEAWETLPAEMIKENAEKMLMTAALGPEVHDYVELNKWKVKGRK